MGNKPFNALTSLKAWDSCLFNFFASSRSIRSCETVIAMIMAHTVAKRRRRVAGAAKPEKQFLPASKKANPTDPMALVAAGREGGQSAVRDAGNER